MWGGWDRYRTSQRWSPQWTRLNTKTTTFNKNTDLWLPPVLTDILLTAFLYTSYTLCLYTETFYYISFTGPENFETLKMLPLKAINIQQHFLWRHWALLSVSATHEYFLIFTGAGNASVDHNFTNMSPLVNFIFVCVLECCSVTLLFIASCHPRFLLRFGWDYVLKIIFNIFFPRFSAHFSAQFSCHW